MSELILVRLRHTLYRLLKHGKSAAHISAELEELVSGCGELDRDDLFLLSGGRSCRLGLHFRELFQIDAHAYVDVHGLAPTFLRRLRPGSTRCQQIAQGVIHFNDLTDAEGVQPELTRHTFLLLREYLDKCVSIFDGYTHLEEILVEDLIADGEAHGLQQEEFDEGEKHLCFLHVEVLVSTQLGQSLLVIRLRGQLLHYLSEEELELDRAHSIENRHFRKHPFGTI